MRLERARSAWIAVASAVASVWVSSLAQAQAQAPAPSPTPSPAVPFQSALTDIVNRSLRIAESRATLQSTEAQGLTARGAFFPTVGVVAKREATRTSTDLADDPIGRRQSIEFGGSLNLFKFGADWSQLQAARAREAAQESRVSDETLRAENEGVRALAGYIESAQEERVYREYVELRGRSLEVARARFARGQLASQEVEKFQLDLGNAEASAADASLRRHRTEAELERLLGHSRVAIEWPWIASLSAGTRRELVLAEENLARRPDWQAAQRALESSEQRVNQSFRLLFPTLDASITQGAYESSGYRFNQWAGALTLSIPIFNQLTGYSAWRVESANRELSSLALERVERDARAEIRSRKADYETALATALNRERTLVVTKRLYETSLRGFQAARATANDLAVEQDRLLQSALLEIRGWSTAHIAVTDLCHALGRRLSECVEPTP